MDGRGRKKIPIFSPAVAVQTGFRRGDPTSYVSASDMGFLTLLLLTAGSLSATTWFFWPAVIQFVSLVGKGGGVRGGVSVLQRMWFPFSGCEASYSYLLYTQAARRHCHCS